MARNPFASPRLVEAAPEITAEQASADRLRELSKEIARLRSEYEWIDGQLMSLRFQFKSAFGDWIGSSIENASEHRAQEFRLVRAQDQILAKLNSSLAEYAVLLNPREDRHVAGERVRA